MMFNGLRKSCTNLAGQHILKQQPDGSHERQGQCECSNSFWLTWRSKVAQQRAGHGKGHQPQADGQRIPLISPGPR